MFQKLVLATSLVAMVTFTFAGQAYPCAQAPDCVVDGNLAMTAIPSCLSVHRHEQWEGEGQVCDWHFILQNDCDEDAFVIESDCEEYCIETVIEAYSLGPVEVRDPEFVGEEQSFEWSVGDTTGLVDVNANRTSYNRQPCGESDFFPACQQNPASPLSSAFLLVILLLSAVWAYGRPAKVTADDRSAGSHY